MSDDGDDQLGLFVKIAAHLGEIKRHIAQQTAWIQRASDRPRNVLFGFSGVCPTPTAPFTLASTEVGGIGPQQGEIWNLRACRIGGVTPTTAATGRGDTYRSGSDPTAAGATGSTLNWVDQAATLPLVAYYGSNEVPIHYPDNFFIVITNGTAGQQYVANALFEIYNDGGYKAEVSL